MNPNTAYLVERIEEELDRLGMLATDQTPAAWCVEAEDDLPDGWVRLYDDYQSVYAPAHEILSRLSGVEAETEDQEGEQSLAGLPDDPPAGHDVWNDFHEFVSGVELPGGLGLVVFRTNAGLRWGFAPEGSDYSAFNSTHDFSDRHETAQDAIEAARSFVAEQEAGERA